MHRLAIYDMDKTVTLAPTWTSFLLATARARAPWRLALLPAAGLATLGYGAKLYDRARLKQLTQRLLLGHRLTRADADAAARAFAEAVTHKGIFAGARARLAADKAAGYRLVMATASYRFYAAAIAERLGFDDAIGTESRLDKAGNLLARIEGENCYGANKLRMIEAWMAQQGIARGDAHIRFYSDHVSDAPALGWADEGYAVRPHRPLRALAAERGWQVLDWER
ncbi:HAD family hydrolase [Sphingomonas aracearum]|uniref:HAD-IB family hydrolase n=1 Tax=Sphingomonas aracearum TaxID=2283317 RepID=A0A369VTU0_9SPHN|nr:HAD-IB family phosphatase [Sphingomonas aracearum]RDE04947.1 HAD-IB family hydrolase [Sphingomonas aracearum]